MRQLALLLLGIALGSICAVVTVNTLRQRDAYPRGLMQVMQHNYLSLRQNVRSPQCDAAAAGKLLARLRDLTADTESAVYGDANADAPFREYAERTRNAVDAAIQAAPGGCSALGQPLDAIGNACEACHHQYR
jgi:cytochrome c556